MHAPVIDLLRGGLPALLALVAAIVAIRIVCRRSTLRRLSFALSLIALTGSVALFRALTPAEAPLLDPYLRFLVLFSLAYGAFKVVEVLVVDLLPGRRGSRQAPAILRDVVAVVIGSFILVVLLRASFGVDVAALVATSAALSIVLGLALQETLSNLFAGLALMLERPFEPGDWIQMGDLIGQVQEVSWRAVRLKLIRQEDFLVVPNSVVAKSHIVNMSQPLPVHGHAIEIGAPYSEPPGRVREALIEAALDVGGVLRQPPPRARIARFDTSAIVYQLVYYLDDYPRIHDIQGEVLSRCWYAFRRHGIEIPFPAADVFWRDAVKVTDDARAAEVRRIADLLRGVEFLEALTSEQLEHLASEARIVPYPVGGAVVRQGDEGDSLFLVAGGRVEVSVHAPTGGAERRLATLGPGDYFGEMSLLTGAPRSATIRAVEETGLVVLRKEALRPLLVADPTVLERLSKTLARRQAERDDAIHRAATSEYEGPGADRAGHLLGLMRRFFGLMGG
ncbi:MAG TPA: mechanosensitive ion channel family protein [Methylomirabilota bacterium]|jgi:small-conductance mechanosensitive channel|nr:mechanosensitive ion channel family protein [Methylomirabilota bacterium]